MRYFRLPISYINQDLWAHTLVYHVVYSNVFFECEILNNLYTFLDFLT